MQDVGYKKNEETEPIIECITQQNWRGALHSLDKHNRSRGRITNARQYLRATMLMALGGNDPLFEASETIEKLHENPPGNITEKHCQDLMQAIERRIWIKRDPQSVTRQSIGGRHQAKSYRA